MCKRRESVHKRSWLNCCSDQHREALVSDVFEQSIYPNSEEDMSSMSPALSLMVLSISELHH